MVAAAAVATIPVLKSAGGGMAVEPPVVRVEMLLPVPQPAAEVEPLLMAVQPAVEIPMVLWAVRRQVVRAIMAVAVETPAQAQEPAAKRMAVSPAVEPVGMS